MNIKLGTIATHSLLTVGLALGVASAHARDYNVTHDQEQLVQPGMTADALKAVLGSPAAVEAVGSEPGPIWTYQVANVSSAIPDGRTLFDIQFGADGRVISANEFFTVPDSTGD